MTDMRTCGISCEPHVNLMRTGHLAAGCMPQDCEDGDSLDFWIQSAAQRLTTSRDGVNHEVLQNHTNHIKSY